MALPRKPGDPGYPFGRCSLLHVDMQKQKQMVYAGKLAQTSSGLTRDKLTESTTTKGKFHKNGAPKAPKIVSISRQAAGLELQAKQHVLQAPVSPIAQVAMSPVAVRSPRRKAPAAKKAAASRATRARATRQSLAEGGGYWW